MAHVVFYEKPGCMNNRLQKALLKASGHDVEAKDLLATPWTVERLEWFFNKIPTALCFNRSAPRIKSGEIDPTRMVRQQALIAMVHEPLLIRRPLMEIDGQPMVGFDLVALDYSIGLVQHRPQQQSDHNAINLTTVAYADIADQETCMIRQSGRSCTAQWEKTIH